MLRPRVNQPLFILVIIAICLNLFPFQLPARTLAAGQAESTPLSTNQPGNNHAALAASPAITTGINFASGYHKTLIQNNNPAAIIGAAKGGGLLLADYGSFSLWKLPDAPGLNGLAQNSAVEKHDEFDRIGLRDGEIDTGKAVDAPALNSQATGDPQLWLVQFVGPIKPEWLESLQSLGIDPVMYMPNNAYVIWADGQQLKQLNEQVATGATELQWAGPYQAGYRLDPALKNRKSISGSAPVTVTVQFYNTSKVQDSLDRLEKLGGKVVREPWQILKFTDVTLQVPPGQLEAISRWPDVFNVEQYAERVKMDEAQGQIVAGNVSAANGKVGPTAPGYLAWLTGLGFPTTPGAYPIVDVVDDGLDNGTTTPIHPDFYTFGDKTNGASRVVATANCTGDALADGTAGHGNLNSGIVGGYNNSSGPPYVDSNGFNRGVGISPFGRLSHTKIFANNSNYDISNCGNSDTGVVLKSYQNGASITSNSWGDNSSPGAYDASSQAYDSLTRDAAGTVAGNQQMLHVFSAGNDGPSGTITGTIGTPGTAKNVLTVGATENVRDQGIADGCGETNADNADDMATFSSRGPTTDGRIKPDIVAPGIHIQGPASQDPAGFNGSGVCGGSGNIYYPNFAQNGITQTLYTWSSGTSHSTPAVAGGLSLLYNYYSRVWVAGQYPSPAMAKALTLNSPRYLAGAGTGDTLPSNSQGWGDLNLGALFDGGPRSLLDQSKVFTTTGQQYTRSVAVHDATKPVRVTLAWTDAPGTTTGDSFVNNLDLQVTINGQTYKGNIFSGSLSTIGGAFDTKNNVENVFLPAGLSGAFTVTVTAANLAGDGVPGNSSPVDQDFALVVYNADANGTTPALLQTNKFLSGGDGDDVIEPGETVNLLASFYNSGDGPASNVQLTLTGSTPGVTINTGAASYGNIASGATVTNTTPFKFTVGSGVPYGTVITLTGQLTCDPSIAIPFTFTFQVGMVTIAQSGLQLGGGDNDQYAEPGENLSLAIGLTNAGNADARIVTGILTSNTPGVSVTANTGNYGDIAAGATVTNTATLYIFRVDPGLACAGTISFTQQVTYSDGTTQNFTITLPVGAPKITNTSATDIPHPISEVGAPTVTSNLPINFAGQVTHIRAKVNITHTWDGDLTLTIISPDGTRVILSNKHGGGGENYTDTVFDDSAAASISSGSAPFSGSYKPDEPLAGFNGKAISGNWQLEIKDNADRDGGALNGWSLEITSDSKICDYLSSVRVVATAGSPQRTPVNTNFQTPLTVKVLVGEGSNNPVQGAQVTYQVQAGSGGASGAFSGNASATVSTDGSGNAIAPVLNANGTKGKFTVTASIGGSINSVAFVLVNTDTNSCGGNVVTSHSDDGTSSACGTLSFALAEITNPNTPITFNLTGIPASTINVSGDGFIFPVASGLTVAGESCANPVIIDGSGTTANADGIPMRGGMFKNLTIQHFKGRQIVATAGETNFRCVKAIK